MTTAQRLFGGLLGAAVLGVSPSWGATNVTLNLGTSYGVQVAEPGEIVHCNFEGHVGQRVFYDALDDNLASITAGLFAPSGKSVFSGNSANDAGPFTLVEDGRYTLAMDGSGQATGECVFRLLDLGADTAVVAEGVIKGQLSPGLQTRVFGFAGSRGQRVRLEAVSASSVAAEWRLVGPQNQVLGQNRIDRDLGEITLPVGGVYAVLVAGTGSQLAPLRFEMLVSDVSETPVAVAGLGEVQSGVINAGQTNTYTFDAPAGLWVYLDNQASASQLYLALLDPTGASVYQGYLGADAGSFVLPRSGTYTVEVRGANASAGGPYQFRWLDLSTVPTLGLNADTQAPLSSPYQTDVYQLPGTGGQRLFYDAIDADSDNVRVRLSGAAGGVAYFEANADADVGPVTLLFDEPCYLFLESRISTATDYRFVLFDLADQPVLSLDQPENGELDPGYSVALFRLNAAAGQRVYLDSTVASGGAYWYLYDPGNVLVPNTSSGLGADLEVTFPVGGTYLLLLSNTRANPVGFAFTPVSAPVSTEALTLNTLIGGVLGEPGERHRYRFSGTAGQRLFYDATDGDNDPIRVRLWDPAGASVFDMNSDSDRGPFTLRLGGEYVLEIDGSNDAVGDYGFQVLALADQPEVALDTTVVDLLDPGRSARIYRLSGTAGQRLYFDSVVATSGAYWYLYGPADTQVPNAGVGLNGDMEVTLPVDGVYCLLLTGAGANPISYGFNVVTFETPGEALTLNASIAGMIAEPGEQRRYDFVGHPGQRLYYDALEGDHVNIQTRLFSPAGVQLWNVNSDTDHGPFSLELAGDYTLVIDGANDLVGSYEFQMLDLADQPELGLDTPVVDWLDPGWSARLYRLAGAAGQRLYLDSTSASGGGTWYLYGPTDLLPSGFSAGLASDLEVTLPVAGTYALLLSSDRATPISFSFSVVTYDTPSDTLTPGDTIAGMISEPGEQHRYAFTGAVGQRLYYDALDAGGDNIRARLYSPSGKQLWDVNSDTDRGPFTLVQAGTYELVIDAANDLTGDYGFRMLDLAAAADYTLGAVIDGNLDPGLESDGYRWVGARGQRLLLDSLGATANQASWSLYGPTDEALVSGGIQTDLGEVTLPMDGEYHLLIQGSSTGGAPLLYQVQLTEVPQGVVTVSGFGAVETGAIAAGETNTFAFTAPAGLWVYYDGQEPAGSTLYAEWFNPAGGLVFRIGAGADQGPLLLPWSGTYRLDIRGVSASSSGTYRFRVLDLVDDAPELVPGTLVAAPLANARQADVYRMAGSVGQRLFYDAREADFDSVTVGLFNPSGTAVAGISGNSDYDRGPVTLSATGTYFVLLDSNVAGPSDYSLVLVDAGSQPELSLDALVTGTLDPPYSARFFRHASTNGEHLYFDSFSTASGATWTVYDPDNASEAAAGLRSDMSVASLNEGVTLLALTSDSPAVLSYSFRVVTYDSASEVLTLGSTVEGTLAEAGESDTYTFAAPSGQRLYYDALDGDFDNIRVALIGPTGNALWEINSDYDRGPFTLAAAGDYQLVFRGNGDVTGDYKFRILDVADQPLLSRDARVSGALDQGYLAHLYRDDAVEGDRLFFNSLSSSAGGTWSYHDGSDAALGNTGLRSDFDVTVAASGPHVLVVRSDVANLVPYLFQVVTYETPLLPLVLGETVTSEIGEPGEADTYTFVGSAGQRLFYDALDADFDQVVVRLLDPDGKVLGVNGNSDYDHGPFTLSTPGPYQLVVSANGDATGNYQFRLLDMADQPALERDTVVSAVLNPGLQAHLYVLSATAGESLYFDSLSSAAGADWRLTDPNDQQVGIADLRNDFHVGIQEAGVYVLAVRGSAGGAVPHSFRVATPNDGSDVYANRGPTMVPLGLIEAGENTPLIVFVAASDPDSGDTLTFSLDPGGAVGPVIHPASGVMEWTPPVTGFSRIERITLRVTDNGSPALSVAQTVDIKVVAAPWMSGLDHLGDATVVWWRSAPAERYRLQYKDLVDDAEWFDLGEEMTAVDFETSFTDSTVGDRDQRYYRILLLSAP